MKNYLSSLVDLTGDRRINPATLDFGDGEGSHGRRIGVISSISIHHDAAVRPHDYDSVVRYVAQAAGDAARLGPGLPYHYRVDNTGVIFGTRPLTTWLNCVGSSENVTTIAICLDGNFQTQQPTLEQCEALFQLLQYLCTQRPDFPATWPDVRPHRDFSATACPGDSLAPYTYAIKDETTARQFPANTGYDWPELQPAPPSPPSTTTTTTQTPPSTTTTTTMALPPTTTTTTEVPPTTTTTTTLLPIQEPGLLNVAWAAILRFINWLRGKRL